jgi:AcrR family transcriptional regulator
MITAMVSVKTRPYRTRIRRGDAPRLVCAAAHRLFTTKGYVATCIDDIAAESGVARPTVFTAVGPKPVILKTVVDQALAGDDAAIPVGDRPWFREALQEPDPYRLIRLHARNSTMISSRVGPLLKALEGAAAVDAEAKELWEEFLGQRRRGVAEIAEALAGRATLRCDVDTITDTLAAMPDMYVRLVREGGWTPERYEEWLADLWQRLFLE